MNNPTPAETPSATAVPSIDDLITIEGMIEQYPGLFSETQLRWALRTRKDNGLNQHVFKLGKMLYLSKSGFAEWLQSRRGL
jgi:hypothetical protein